MFDCGITAELKLTCPFDSAIFMDSLSVRSYLTIIQSIWAKRERSKFPLTAHAFCNPRSLLRSRSQTFPLPLPLHRIFSCPAPANSIFRTVIKMTSTDWLNDRQLLPYYTAYTSTQRINSKIIHMYCEYVRRNCEWQSRQSYYQSF